MDKRFVFLSVFLLCVVGVSADYFQPVVLQGDGSATYNISVCTTNVNCGDVNSQVFPAVGSGQQIFYLTNYTGSFNTPYWYTAYNSSGEIIQDKVKSRLFGDSWAGNISLGVGGVSYVNVSSYLRLYAITSCNTLGTDATGLVLCIPNMLNETYLNATVDNRVSPTYMKKAADSNLIMGDYNSTYSLGYQILNRSGHIACYGMNDSGAVFFQVGACTG